MFLTRLQVRQLRCLRDVDLQPAPGLNVLVGANGAGKSSLVEAVHLLGYGRSFRGRVGDGLVRTGQLHLEVYAEWTDGDGQPHRAGLRHSGARWEGRMDGVAVPSLAELCATRPSIVHRDRSPFSGAVDLEGRPGCELA